MTFEQAGMVPKSGDQAYPFLFPQIGENPRTPFPTFQRGPDTPAVPKEVQPQVPSDAVNPVVPDPAPFDALKLMESWESAYKKAHTGWQGGLTEKEIDEALAGNKLQKDEREALKTIKANFADLSGLDGDQLAILDQSDLTLFKVLLANTARDVQFYEKGQKFLSENKTKLDLNYDGKLDWYEVYKAKTNPDFKEDQLETISYLSDRYSHTLRHTDVEKTALLFNTYGSEPVPEQDFVPGGLGKVIDNTQSLAYSYKFVDDYRGFASGLAFGAATLASKYFNMGFWAKTGTLVGSVGVTAFALKKTAQWQGPIQQDDQDARIRRLMTNVANFNY